MKIAIILPQLKNFGGAERVVTNLANYWAKQQLDIIIITFNMQVAVYYNLEPAIKCYSLFNKKATRLTIINLVTSILNLRKLLTTHQIDIAIGIDIRANFILSIASIGIAKLISIATEHRHPPTAPAPKWLLKIVRLSYGRMNAIVALTKESQQWFKRNIFFNYAALIPNAVNYPLAINQPIILPATIINKDKFTLLASGRLAKVKGFDLLIPIFAKLVIKHINWQLVILGEGEQRKQLEQQIKYLNLENKVYLPGAVGNLADWYKSANLFVFPSRYEGFGCALVEAMAYGLPSVSFDCKTGPRDIIRHGVDGLLVEAGNTTALFTSLDKLMSDKKAQQQFANEAVFVRERFSIEKINAMWQKLFCQLQNIL